MLRWAQLGPHRVTALLGGAAVPGTPLAVTVGPAPLHPPACLLRGLGGPAAGGLGLLAFEVHGRDAFGNAARLDPRAVEVAAEPAGALGKVDMGQWEDRAAVTVRSTVFTEGVMHVRVNGRPVCEAGHRLAAAAGPHSGLAFLSGGALRAAAGAPASALLEVRKPLSPGFGLKVHKRLTLGFCLEVRIQLTPGFVLEVRDAAGRRLGRGARSCT